MLYCQSAPEDHRAAAVYALSFASDCGHEYPIRTLACLQHGAQLRSQPQRGAPDTCQRCGQVSGLRLARIEDVFEERVVIRIPRSALESSAHPPVMFAYDRAYRDVAERGLLPVTTYRVPVEWSWRADSRPVGADVLEAQVTMAVTLQEQPGYRAG
jgi:hypothetical protein